MVAPAAMTKMGGLSGTGKATLAGNRLMMGDDPQRQNTNVQIRHWDDEPTYLKPLQMADNIGNGVFMAGFMVPAVPWVARKTVGYIPRIGQPMANGVAAVTSVPLRMFQNMSVGELMSKPVSAFSGGYSRAFAGYRAEHTDFQAKHGKKTATEAHQLIEDAKLKPPALDPGKPGTKFLNDHMGHRMAKGAIKTGVKNGQDAVAGLIKEASRVNQLSHVEGPLKELQGMLAKPHHEIDIRAVQTKMDEISGMLRRVEAAKGPSSGPAATKMLGKITEMGGHMNVVEHNMAAARDGRGLFASLGASVKNASVFDVAFKGGMALGAGYYALRTVTHAGDAITYLKELNEDLTGEKISTYDLLTGNHLSPMMKEARSNMILRFGPEAVAGVASIATNLVFMKHNMGSKEMAIMLGAFGLQAASGTLAPKQYLLDTYIQMKDMQKGGMPIAPEYYAQLIDAASADARAAGGDASRLVQGIALEYATEQKPPAEVLKEIQQKEPFHQRAKRVGTAIKKADDAKHKKPEINKPLVMNGKGFAAQKAAMKNAKPNIEKPNAALPQGEQPKDVPSTQITSKVEPEKAGVVLSDVNHEGRVEEQAMEMSR